MNKRSLQVAALVGLCFLLTSTSFLAWTYHLLALAEAPFTDACTLVGGYLLQAAGIGLFSYLAIRREDLVQFSVNGALALHMLCLVPSVLGTSLVQALIFGSLLNLACGWIGGYYLYRLTGGTTASEAAGVLGKGYAMSILLTWILSTVGGGAVWRSYIVLFICLALTAAVFAVGRRGLAVEEEEEGFHLQIPGEMPFGSFLALAGVLVLFFSMTNSCGFGFPSGDLEKGVNLEFSRLFYAVGLLIAGCIHDRNRRYGAVCTVGALVIPFLTLAIRGEPVSLTIFWALSYFTFGFFTIYRVILFSDIAREKKMLHLSGAGLMVGRVGDALGEALCLGLADKYLLLIGVTAVLFVACVFLSFRLYYCLYMPEAKKERSEREIFNHFSAMHDLSAREREVLRYLLEEKTNQEIAEELSISEGTVKYHIHNLLQKTSCRNRLELITRYSAEK